MRVIKVSDVSPREIAVYEDGKLCEYILDDTASDADAIILGRVERVVPGMKAAFVNIGQAKNGFLPMEEKGHTFSADPLRDGMRVAVQVKREAHGEKGAFLSRDITLCGTYAILMPMNRYIGVSARVEDEEEKKRLRELGAEIAQGNFGLVMRNTAAEATEEVVREEVAQLLTQWQELKQKILVAPVAGVVWKPQTQLDSLLRDYAGKIDMIETDSTDMAGQLDAGYNIHIGPIDTAEIRRERDKALSRHVWLKSGGSLMIDHCEAMTVIDVNTAKFTGKKLLEDTVTGINIEACAEIARQLRLRNVGGVVVIDFIDMAQIENRERVQQALQQALAADRVKTVVHGYTSLGLMEMTRKRTRQSLRESLTKACPHCHGEGIIFKEETNG